MMAEDNNPSSQRPYPSTPVIFLKLGGSLITDKNQASTPHMELIDRLASEIAEVMQMQPELQLLLGHGSGSFGHMAAQKFNTHKGVHTKEEWNGFVEVWRQAAALNHILIEALHHVGLPAISFPASASATTVNGVIKTWDIEPLRAALQNNLLPVVFGDVAFDDLNGGTILSTEDIFIYLSTMIRPQKILLAGIEPGVYADYPENKQLLSQITRSQLGKILPNIKGSSSTDVTGGMASKVNQMMDLIDLHPKSNVFIFCGLPAGSVKKALLGEPLGTRLKKADN